jgi:hypothetical protein
MYHIRVIKTASGASAVQVVYYSGYFSDVDPQNGHADPLVGFISKN